MRHGRLRELRVLRAVHELTGGRSNILQKLRNNYNIDTTGVYVATEHSWVQGHRK